MEAGEQRLTAEEHHARAMLLGLIYIGWAHMYVNEKEWNNPPIHDGQQDTWLDADTIEPIPQDEKMDRLFRNTRFDTSMSISKEMMDEFRLEMGDIWQRS